ncbi:hypothetical protein IQ06DRAFT_101515 [Phaeosphaeriaceae sp. SRC1lsM3a]|nr:hypothetical protein IQ06DRAFT_101515 [Stagonospora sp. SRC1lsM3a]
MQTENLRVTNMVPTMQAKVQSLEREVRRTKSDLDHKTREAENHKNQVYSLQVELESTVARLGDEMQTLKDTLRSVEGERDTLKTSLKEEEVMRIAAEGHIPLPSAGVDEMDEFGSPVRSPRKQRTVHRLDDDKENVSPKKQMVDLKLLQSELATERRLRERAQDQIEFMKMECQFQCCSCRIAENRGKEFVHDNTFASEMQRIKTSVPVMTPPPSAHGDGAMEGVVIQQEPFEHEQPSTPPAEASMEADDAGETSDNTAADRELNSESEAVLAFSPSTGTFRAVASPVKAPASTHISTPAKPSGLGISAVTETFVASSPWTPDAHSTMIAHNMEPELSTSSRRNTLKENKAAPIEIHEDAIEDEEDEDLNVEDSSKDQVQPETPARYELHTTTTTIPIAFSPATPAFRPGRGPMTPSTVAHAASDAQTPVLGELSINKVAIDREKALQQIRERRGRARSMANSQATPMKQMMQGVKDRRDISAPVLRTRT